eukprot:1359587-Amorphochlora_amoeboformis.AAC.1
MQLHAYATMEFTVVTKVPKYGSNCIIVSYQPPTCACHSAVFVTHTHNQPATCTCRSAVYTRP